jgi:hypothetical protein
MISNEDIPLIRGGKLTPEMLRFITEAAKHFPGCERDIIVIRKPNPVSARLEIGTEQREQETSK